MRDEGGGGAIGVFIKNFYPRIAEVCSGLLGFGQVGMELAGGGMGVYPRMGADYRGENGGRTANSPGETPGAEGRWV